MNKETLAIHTIVIAAIIVIVNAFVTRGSDGFVHALLHTSINLVVLAFLLGVIFTSVSASLYPQYYK
jgi:hypothetical protein